MDEKGEEMDGVTKREFVGIGKPQVVKVNGLNKFSFLMRYILTGNFNSYPNENILLFQQKLGIF